MDPGERPLSALPSSRARALAFAAILVAGICGALIGSSLVSIQCQGDCATAIGLGALAGAAAAGGGVAVVATLVLRAMGEWRQIKEAELQGEAGPDDRVNP
jgi:hypothetical protein